MCGEGGWWGGIKIEERGREKAVLVGMSAAFLFLGCCSAVVHVE